MIRIAIVGSREFASESKVRDFVRSLMSMWGLDEEPFGVEIVSGGAPGPDSWAEDEARKLKIPVNIHYAQWELYGKSAGMIRNGLIVADSDIIIAFWDGKSKGTLDTINKSITHRKSVITVTINDPNPSWADIAEKLYPEIKRAL